VAAVIAIPLKRNRFSWKKQQKRVVASVVGLIFIAFLGCQSGEMRRPPGYFRLGLVVDLARSPETHFSDYKILLRRDGQGFSAMSTACTYDLTPLMRVGQPGDEHWRSSYTESEYGADGQVLHGPAKAPLPFYFLRIAPGEYGGKPDTLFVEVGVTRPKEWRLPLS
jgi:hypothetical protein